MAPDADFDHLPTKVDVVRIKKANRTSGHLRRDGRYLPGEGVGDENLGGNLEM
jgi:hypothetical protein